VNIAVVLDQNIQKGGGFQQALSSIIILNNHKTEAHNFIFLTTAEANVQILKNYGIDAKYIRLSLFDKLIGYLSRIESVYWVIRKFRLFSYGKFDKYLMNLDIDLVYFLSPSSLVLKTEVHNYILSVWDLCHRDFMEFPEIRDYKEFEDREMFYITTLKKAVAVIVDSELSKENIVRRYGIDRHRVVSLPFLPSKSVAITKEEEYDKKYINIKKKYNIQGEYIFYPAQFWAHKNHHYILDALRYLKQKYNRNINAVFCGFDKGNLDFVLRKAKEYGIEGQIFCIGFVNDIEIPYLYRQSIALVMPTYFGPTNIPPLEAFALDCPVCYSDLPRLREQVEDAAYLMDLKDPKSLANILLSIIEDLNLRNEKIRKGRLLLDKWNEKDYWNGLIDIFNDYEVKLRCWK
jgi:glycosyltransferase involved in cell wall biosynthesis